MVLTKNESEALRYLRNPAYSSTGIMRTVHSPVEELTDEELVSLYNKMDDVIKDEGNTRRKLGCFDEMYVLELSGVKDILLKECSNRDLNMVVN